MTSTKILLGRTSSVGKSVLFISESWTASHSASMVHISSILLSFHICPMMRSPLTEGKFHPFGVVLVMSL